ncbi:MAG: TIGR03013 family XrtA/PEP-CTERM system glycosyltransferase [Trichloromonadaceae bacterium]
MLIIGDLILAFAALLFGFLVRFPESGVEGLWAGGWLRLLIFVGVLVFASYFCELYIRERNTGVLPRLARIVACLALSFVVLSVLYYALPELLVGRGVLLLALSFYGLAQFLWHTCYQLLLSFPQFASRVLVFGAGPLAEQIVQIIPNQGRNLVFAGFISPEPQAVYGGSGQIVGSVGQVAETVNRERAHKLVISLAERRGVLPVREILRCKLRGVDVIDDVSFYEEMTGKLLLENIQPSWFLFGDGFRVTDSMRFGKRLLDIALSLLGIVLVAPLLPLIALAIKLDSPGPALFRQQRVGEGEKLFQVAKFRTMRQDAEAATGAVWAQKNDPRVTRLGRFLRKSRMDELPQLFNVLMGTMSLVGPRPERPEFVEKLEQRIPYYAKRHFVKPGVTGWAQVRYPYGASEEDALEKLRFDLYYVKNYSLLFDLTILLETVKVCLFGRGGR